MAKFVFSQLLMGYGRAEAMAWGGRACYFGLHCNWHYQLSSIPLLTTTYNRQPDSCHCLLGHFQLLEAPSPHTHTHAQTQRCVCVCVCVGLDKA